MKIHFIMPSVIMRYSWPDNLPPTRIFKKIKKFLKIHLSYASINNTALQLCFSVPESKVSCPLSIRVHFSETKEAAGFCAMYIRLSVHHLGDEKLWKHLEKQDALSIKHKTFCIMSTQTLSTRAQCVLGGLSSQGLQDDFWFCSPRNG